MLVDEPEKEPHRCSSVNAERRTIIGPFPAVPTIVTCFSRQVPCSSKSRQDHVDQPALGRGGAADGQQAV